MRHEQKTDERQGLRPLLVNLSFLISQPTGLATYAANLFPHLQSLHPTLLTANPIDNFDCYPIPPNLTPAQGTRGHLNRLLWTQFKLPTIYQKLKASLVFSPVPEAPLYRQCRSVVMVHDLIPLRFPRLTSPLTPYFRYFVPQVLAQAEHIICNSEATAKDVGNFYGIPASKITPIPLAYDAGHFRVLAGELETETPENPPYFLYLGRHDPYKNLHRLVDAFAQLPHCRDYQLWLAGPPDRRYTPQLQARVRELGLTEAVKFLDYVPYERLPILLNRALALVFPTLWEGFGLPVLEAMACGTPVIASNLASLPEVTGEAALLVSPYQTQEIAGAMAAVAADRQLRSRLKSLSIQQAGKFSWAKTGQATREVLEKYLI